MCIAKCVLCVHASLFLSVSINLIRKRYYTLDTSSGLYEPLLISICKNQSDLKIYDNIFKFTSYD